MYNVCDGGGGGGGGEGEENRYRQDVAGRELEEEQWWEGLCHLKRATRIKSMPSTMPVEVSRKYKISNLYQYLCSGRSSSQRALRASGTRAHIQGGIGMPAFASP